ncbi:MAG: DUF2283 domain-containing protein [bacterium]|nr:DUF2283 domain-containing protein [bacterium]
MKITYDHSGDAMYIKLTDKLIVTTRSVNENVALDLDEFDEIVGIEILSVRTSGIDPLSLTTIHYTPDHPAEFVQPTEAELAQRRAEKSAALQRRRERQQQMELQNKQS